MRLIDADALIAQAEEDMFACEAEQFAAMVSWIPTIDAVPVARCKDCKHYDEGCCVRGDYWPIMCPDDFCSYGERRSDD